VNLSLSLNTGLLKEIFWKWRAEDIRVALPDKEEATAEWGVLSGIKGVDSEHVDTISIVHCLSGEC
jgi:hypothetical protein